MRGLARSRQRLMRLIFFLALAWPPLHIVASHRLGFSSWRYLGWGMYATPYPESLATVSVVWLPANPITTARAQSLYAELRLARGNQPLSDCVDIWTADPRHGLREAPSAGWCRDDAVLDASSRVLQFGSRASLTALVSSVAGTSPTGERTRALVIVVRQRLRLRTRIAYTQARLFIVDGDTIRALPASTLKVSKFSPRREAPVSDFLVKAD